MQFHRKAIPLILALLLAACAAPASPATEAENRDEEHAEEAGLPEFPAISAVELPAGQALRVVASTDIIADVVRNVAGEQIELTALIGAGQDPHGYSPTAQDIAALEDADLIFTNGFNFEENLIAPLEALESGAPVVPVSFDVPVRERVAREHEEGEEHEGEEHDHGRYDPHTWLDPQNVIIWTANIARALSEADPAHAEAYAANAEAYQAELAALDEEIEASFSAIPAERRLIVTDHMAFGYFAARYGFEVLGAVIPSVTTSAEASAGNLAELADAMRERNVTVIFVGSGVNPDVAATLAEEVGAEVTLAQLYDGTLGPLGSGADTYLGMMRANAATLVSTLGE